MPNQIDKLTELKNEVSASLYGMYYYELPDGKQHNYERKLVDHIMSKVETEILKHYISREEVLGKLPAYKQYGSNYTLTNKTTQKYIKEKTGEVTGYNQALSDMRQALTTNVKE